MTDPTGTAPTTPPAAAFETTTAPVVGHVLKGDGTILEPTTLPPPETEADRQAAQAAIAAAATPPKRPTKAPVAPAAPAKE
jgi:hypothetical protein